MRPLDSPSAFSTDWRLTLGGGGADWGDFSTPAPTALPPCVTSGNTLGPFRPPCCTSRRSFISACAAVEPRRGRHFHPTSQVTTAMQSSSEREGQGPPPSRTTTVEPPIPKTAAQGGESETSAPPDRSREDHDEVRATRRSR